MVTLARIPLEPMLLRGHTVIWLIAGSGGQRPFRLGQKRLGTVGSLQVRGGGRPVQYCLPFVLAHVADP